MYPEDLLAVILRAAAERAKIDPKVVDDIQTGNVLQELGGIKVGRAAMFAAGKYTTSLHLLLLFVSFNYALSAETLHLCAVLLGFPYTTTYGVLNRQCSSGLQACNYVANAIRAGEIDVGIGRWNQKRGQCSALYFREILS